MGKEIHIEIVRLGRSGGGTALTSVNIDSSRTVADLKKTIYSEKKFDRHFQPCRQRLVTDKKDVLKVLYNLFN
jgi:hypothetical protein